MISIVEVVETHSSRMHHTEQKHRRLMHSASCGITMHQAETRLGSHHRCVSGRGDCHDNARQTAAVCHYNFVNAGTGKTSLVMALAGALGLDIYVVTLSSPTMTDETLRHLLNSAGAKSILLLEDVDAAFVERSAAAGAATSRLTFSGLLNAIDGVAAQEGRLLFMTTNHIDRLSKALIRPGRVDVRCYLGPATQQQAVNLFVAFYRDLPHGLLGQQSAATNKTNMLQDTPAVESSDAAAAAAAARSSDVTVPPPHGADTSEACMANADAATAPVSGTTQQQKHHQQLTRLESKGVVTPLQEVAAREVLLQKLASQFASHLPEKGGVSMAQLQGYLMIYRKDPWAAAANVQQLLQQQQGG